MSYPLGVKEAVLVHLAVYSIKRSTAGALAVHSRVLSEKKLTVRLHVVLLLSPLNKTINKL